LEISQYPQQKICRNSNYYELPQFPSRIRRAPDPLPWQQQQEADVEQPQTAFRRTWKRLVAMVECRAIALTHGVLRTAPK